MSATSARFTELFEPVQCTIQYVLAIVYLIKIIKFKSCNILSNAIVLLFSNSDKKWNNEMTNLQRPVCIHTENIFKPSRSIHPMKWSFRITWYFQTRRVFLPQWTLSTLIKWIISIKPIRLDTFESLIDFISYALRCIFLLCVRACTCLIRARITCI